MVCRCQQQSWFFFETLSSSFPVSPRYMVFPFLYQLSYILFSFSSIHIVTYIYYYYYSIITLFQSSYRKTNYLYLNKWQMVKVRQFRKDFLVSSNCPNEQTNSFVHFLGEFEDTKSPFEII